jgi:glycosyltransferase involved in cell wall biosynthesis
VSSRPRAATSLPEPAQPAALRVLWLTKGLGPGGAERLLVTHAAAADPERVSYQAAYLLPEKTHLVGELEHLGVRTHALLAPRPLDLRWLGRLRALVLAGDFDVVHAHSPAPAALARLALRALPPTERPAFVSTEHNVWSSHTVVTRTANSVTYGLNDASIAVSEEVRASMSPRWRIDTRVVHHGIDVGAVRALGEERDKVRAELGIGADEVLAVTVANFRAPKGYPDLFEAARQVGARGAPVRFVVVGQGPLADELARRHDELGLGSRLRILGYRPDAPRLTAAADLFVLASHHEGLPVSVMEAFAAGVPVVATDVGGLAEAVTDGRSGRLVPPHRPDLLADSVAELAADPDERHRLGRGAADDADRFSAARSELEVEDVYLAAIERAALRSPSVRVRRSP